MKNLLTLFLFAITLHGSSQVLYDVAKGQLGSSPYMLTSFNGKLFFYGIDSNNVDQAWYADVNNAPQSLNIKAFVGTAQANRFYENGLYAQDKMGICNGKLYTGMTSATSAKLYEYDGINPPVIAPGMASTNITSPRHIVSLNDKLYFGAFNNGAHDLWEYTPATGNTKKITNNAASTLIPRVLNTAVYNGKIYFHDKSLKFSQYDPVSGNISQPKINGSPFYPADIHVYNGKMYVKAHVAASMSLYEFDGTNFTALTTPPLDLDIYNSTGPYTGNTIIGYNGAIYYAARKYTDPKPVFELHKYDLGTKTVSKIVQGSGAQIILPNFFCEYGGRLFFQASDDVHGTELWCYDGINPPYIAAEITAGSQGSFPTELTVVDKTLFFAAINRNPNITGTELYKLYTPGLDVANIHFKGEATIYPNPTHDYTTLSITLQQPQTLHISITDAQGRVVYNIPARYYAAQQHSIQLPVAQLAAGVYQYAIYNSNILLASGKLVRE